MKNIIKICIFIIMTTLSSFGQQGGYVNRQSNTVGDTLQFYISSSNSNVNVRIFKIESASNKTLVTTLSNVPAGIKNVPDSAFFYGCKWEPSISFVIPENYKPGIYSAEFPISGNTYRVLFIVKPKILGSTSKTLLLMNTATWQAYNKFGGKNLYDEGAVTRSAKVSFLRPSSNYVGQYNFSRWETEIITWATRNREPIELASDYDMHNNQELLDNYDILMINGHAEYWSLPQRQQLERFIAAGKKVIMTAGNFMWWQVRYEDDGNTLVCYKSRTQDPLNGVRNELVTVNWISSPVRNPENKVMGTTFDNGGYVNSHNYLLKEDGFTDFAAFNTHSWLYKGTNLIEGDEFGWEYSISDHEVDGMKLKWENGIPKPSGTENIPNNFTVLGISPAERDLNKLENGIIGYYYNSNGGIFFNAASITFSRGINNDPVVGKIFNNVWKVIKSGNLPPEIKSWGPFRIDSSLVNNQLTPLNKRDLSIDLNETLNFHIDVVDPFKKNYDIEWRLNNRIVSTNHEYSFRNRNSKDSIIYINAIAFNHHDTTSINWTLVNHNFGNNNEYVFLKYSVDNVVDSIEVEKENISPKINFLPKGVTRVFNSTWFIPNGFVNNDKFKFMCDIENLPTNNNVNKLVWLAKIDTQWINLGGVLKDNDLVSTQLSRLNISQLAIGEANMLLNIKVALENPINKISIPKDQPYNHAPFNYTENITYNNFSLDIVDWVLVELRTSPESNSNTFRKAVLFTKDNTLTDNNGNDIYFNVPAGEYYVVIQHRNHLAIMSKNPVYFDSFSREYDFTKALNMYYGEEASVNNGLYTMTAGNSNHDELISADDYEKFKVEFASGQEGYLDCDFNLDGIVNSTDFNILLKNFKSSKKSNVPK